MNTNEKNKFNAAFGRFIKETRTRKGIPQLNMCRFLGVSQGYYSLIESGERNVDLQLAFKICQYLNLDLSEFLKNYK